MHDRAAPVGDFRDFADGLDGPGLIVCAQDGNEHGVVPHGPRDLVGLHDAVPVGRDLRDREPLPFHGFRGIEHGVMLDAGYDDVPAPIRPRLRQPLDGQVVRLRAAGREYDLTRIGADQPGDPAARPVQRAAGFHARPVQAGRIAGVFPETGHHLVDDAGVNRRRGAVVEVDHDRGRSSRVA